MKEKIAHDDDDLMEDAGSEESWMENPTQDERWNKNTPPKRALPKWRNIEDYWEERRLRDQLKDDLLDG